MRWETVVLGVLASFALLLALATKWKLPLRLALTGIAMAVLGVVIPFLWIDSQLDTAWSLAVALVAQIGGSVSAAMTLAMICFWRDPDRTPPEQDGVILSAADGEVVYITAVDEGSTPLVTKGGRDYPLRELTGTSLPASAAYVIGVEMNLLNVHVNRCPIAGQVKLLKHIEGRFMSLRKDEAPFVNERLTTIIENVSLTVAVVQVASRLVRRIESYLSMGEIVSVGQRLGMIRFGSLVAVVLPKREDLVIDVKIGDRVTAGVSILARYAADGGTGENEAARMV
ncbi:MAG: phosphatidylserine decarboxylase [Anaerolineae bacterium]